MNRWKNIGTWNVMTMLKPGKMYKIAHQMLSNKIQIIALQEIRWKGRGQMKKNTECKKQERSKQHTPGNPFQKGQQEDQRYTGRMMLKRYSEVKSTKLEDLCPG